MTDDNSIPVGWQLLTFGKIAESITERVETPSASGLDHYVGLEHLDPDTLRISRWGSPADVGATKLRFYPGDVIYARRRAYQRKLGVAEWDGICSAHALVLRAHPEVCLPEFLPYFLQSDQFHQRALDISVGSLSPTINWKTLAVQKFALPPLPVQRTTVDALDATQECVTKHTAVVNAIRLLRESLLREPAEEGFWELHPLSEFADVVSGESWSSADESSVEDEDAVAVLGIASLKPDGSIDSSQITYVRGLGTKPRLFRTNPLTLLVIRTNGNADRIGNVYRSDETVAGRALSAFIFGCRFRDVDQMDLAFEYMRGRRFQTWATSIVAGSTGLKNLPIRELRKLPVPTTDCPPAAALLAKLRALRTAEDAALCCISASQRTARVLREHFLGGADVR